jgi:hypothetical protein
MINDTLNKFYNLNKEIENIIKIKNDLTADEKNVLIDTMYETRNIIISAIREIDEDYVEYDEKNDVNSEIFIDEDVDVESIGDD